MNWPWGVRSLIPSPDLTPPIPPLDVHGGLTIQFGEVDPMWAGGWPGVLAYGHTVNWPRQMPGLKSDGSWRPSRFAQEHAEWEYLCKDHPELGWIPDIDLYCHLAVHADRTMQSTPRMVRR